MTFNATQLCYRWEEPDTNVGLPGNFSRVSGKSRQWGGKVNPALSAYSDGAIKMS